MTTKFVHTLLLALIAALLLVGSWLLGKYQGESEARIVGSSVISSVEAQRMIFSLQAQISEKNAEALNANRYTQACDARTQALQTELDAVLRENLLDSIDLALFRRIETSSERRGIALESLQWSPLQPETLELTIIQWRGHDRIKGELQLILNYSQFVPGAVQKVGKSDTNSVNWAVRLEPIAFDFRFFQKIKATIFPPVSDLSDGNEGFSLPESVDARILTADDSLKWADTRIPWIDIAE